MTTRFIYFGRLVKEKGFDTLFPYLRTLATGEKPGCFAIFGSGELESNFLSELSHLPYFQDASKIPEESIQEVWNKTENGIVYFAQRSFDAIRGVLLTCNASVMPSKFLETFGLSALESITCGIPVIAPAKGGLKEFIVSDEYKMSNFSKIENILEKISEIDEKTQESHKKIAREMSEKFTKESWINTVKSHIGEAPKKILLVSDYLGNLGGTEGHIATIEKTLEQAGYSVKVLGQKKKKMGKISRILSILVSFCNIFAYFSLQKAIKAYSPDIIWCHSIARRIGPVGLLALKKSDAKLVITYHDLGYFTPRAAALESEKSIPGTGFISFWKEETLPGKYFPVYTVAKYIKLLSLFKILEDFDTHFVPSEFMTSPVAARIGQKKNTIVLPHFRKEDEIV